MMCRRHYRLTDDDERRTLALITDTRRCSATRHFGLRQRVPTAIASMDGSSNSLLLASYVECFAASVFLPAGHQYVH